jgi:spore coat protein U domain-containing protein, fimbrial subunit CupE1/2/3/6
MRRTVPLHAVALACALTVAASMARADGCTVGTTGINFGNYDVFSTLNDDITATIDVNCPNGTAYSILLSSGSGTFGSRTLTAIGSVLGYNLYLDPTRLTIWGDGTGGTGTVSGIGTGANVGTPVYGRIPAGQNVAVGSYTDLITVTVTF